MSLISNNPSLVDINQFVSLDVKRVVLDCGTTFLEIFQAIESEFKTCYLLESAKGFESDSHFGYIGFDPDMIISARSDTLTFQTKTQKTQKTVDNPYRYLQSIFPHNQIHIEFCGGLVGYMGTEAVNYVEPALHLEESDDFESFAFGLYTDGLILNKQTGVIEYFFRNENRLHIILDLLKKTPKDTMLQVQALGDSLSFEEHQRKVSEVLGEINRGNVFQCEVGFRSDYLVDGDTTKLYSALIQNNPSPYMFYLKNGDEVVLGSSPEMLFKLRNGVMSTKPLAGTIRRGKDTKEDEILQKKLLCDPKERAEHRMLIDMHRNDIGKNAQVGTVVLTKEMEIVSLEHVHHLLSEIIGVIRDDRDMFDGLAGLFPGGVLNGAPKIEAIKIITRQEERSRGVYGGAVGWFGFNGDCTFCIPIRSLFVKGKKSYIQACSGIVIDSDPVAEYEEVQKKLASLRDVLTKYII